MDFSIVHEFDCDLERYWQVFFDEPYNAALYRELGIRERKVLERREEQGGAILHRVVRIVPQAAGDVAALLQKFVSGEIAYLERSTFRREKNQSDVTVELDVPAIAKKFDLHGIYTVKSVGMGRVRREFSASIKVAILLVGGQIERKVAEAIRQNYETTAAFTRRWLAEHI